RVEWSAHSRSMCVRWLSRRTGADRARGNVNGSNGSAVIDVKRVAHSPQLAGTEKPRLRSNSVISPPHCTGKGAHFIVCQRQSENLIWTGEVQVHSVAPHIVRVPNLRKGNDVISV